MAMHTTDFEFQARLSSWSAPAHWKKISTIDAHTAGEPLRVIVSGYPAIPGATLLERRAYLKDHLDELRTTLMWEPRGHREMYGCVVTQPVNPENHFAVLFMHNEGYSTMCGHGIIAIATVALETGMVAVSEPVSTLRIESPAGLITASAVVAGGKVKSVSFRNVPSFVVALDETVNVPGIGRIRYDLAFGGAFYAYVQASQLDLHCTVNEYPLLVEKGMAIKRAIMQSRPIPHPYEKDLGFLYGTIFIAPSQGRGANSRNVCIFADGEVDRSPTGTGVSGLVAVHHARKELVEGESIVIESIIGTRFTGRFVDTTTFGGYDAVIPEVEGSAHITGRHDFVIDPDDPLSKGFII